MAYYFDRSCETQMRLLSTGREINYPDVSIIAKAATQAFDDQFSPGMLFASI